MSAPRGPVTGPFRAAKTLILAVITACVTETREWMGPGGLHGLQIRWQAAFAVCGGFDSLALPPNICTPAGLGWRILTARDMFARKWWKARKDTSGEPARCRTVRRVSCGALLFKTFGPVTL